IRARARQTIIDGYDRNTICLPRHIRLIEDLVNRRQPETGSGPAPAPVAAPVGTLTQAPAPVTTSLERAMTLAHDAEARKDWPEAERIYRLITEQVPGAHEAFYRLGLALHSLARHGDAAGAMARAVELAPHVGYYHCDLGVMYRHLGDLDRRLACYRRAVELEPGNVTAMVNLVSALNDVGDSEEGERIARRAMEIAPDAFSVHLNLGSSLMRQLRMD
ncbi:MAG: tetratricopeptide repeat protein, partial [Alphaproteobacteria bacterium]|nr:tetratricopeptide repeat protein [Alphaproteobacteria bacterium]